jgi:DNA-binding transcriptional LysR family regulator
LLRYHQQMDRLDAMRLFVRVAELGNFSAAAQQLGVDRSAVTRQVAGLEERLGIRLMARSTRRLSLTAAGAQYLEKCRVILNLVEDAETGLAAEGSAPRGPVHLTVPLSFGRRYLSPCLLDFARNNPEVQLSVDYADRRSKLIEEGIDLAVRITSRLEPTDVARRLSASRMRVIAAPAYLARHGAPRSPSELVHHECLAYSGAARPEQWEFSREGRVERVSISARLQANNGDALLEAVQAGFGVSCAPDFLCADALAQGTVVPLLEDYAAPLLGIYAVLPGNRHVPHRVRLLIEHLAAGIGDPPPWEKLRAGTV